MKHIQVIRHEPACVSYNSGRPERPLKTCVNPVRYSVALLLMLTLCLQFAENMSVVLAHSNWELSDVMLMHKSSLLRELAYIVMAAGGVIGIIHARRCRIKFEWSWRIVITLALLLI